MASTPVLSNAVCRICLTEPTCPTATPCRHTFCYECITTHLSTRNLCPICSTFLTVQSLQASTSSLQNHNQSSTPSPALRLHPNGSSRPPSPRSVEHTPEITSSMSSRRAAPPPLRTRYPTPPSPSTQAARRIRAEALLQATNNQLAPPPPPHLISAHPHIHSSLISASQQTNANLSYLHSSHPSLTVLPSRERRSDDDDVDDDDDDDDVNKNLGLASDSDSISAGDVHTNIPASATLPVASTAATPSMGTHAKLSALSSALQNTSNADAFLAATENLSAEQLAGVIAQLSQKLHKKERNDRHIENHLLLHFLRHSRRRKETALRRIQTQLEVLSSDIRTTETQCALQRTIDTRPLMSTGQTAHTVPINVMVDPLRNDPGLSRKRQRVVENFDVLENHYFNTVGQQKAEEPRKRALKNFTDDVYKLTQFSRLRDFTNLMHIPRVPDAPGSDVFKASNIVSSMEFDRDSEFLATAGVTRKIKIFEFSNISRNVSGVHYPIREIPTQAKISWVCWNPYIRHHLLSSDYEGVLKIWDVNTASALSEYEEHECRAWCVDYCPTKPAYFSSGSDDGTVKIWTTTQRNSVMTLNNKKANVCSVKFHPTTPELLAFGSMDQSIKYYDLRSPAQPLQTFESHTRAVSYVKFMSNNELVSASVDSTVKMWDLQNLSLTRTFTGHVNHKNFVGLSVTSDFIACGSEENMIYCYYKAVPRPLTSFRFPSVDPLTGDESADDDETQFVSSVCWCPNDPTMLVGANSLGTMKVLKLESEEEVEDDGERQKDSRKKVRTEDNQ